MNADVSKRGKLPLCILQRLYRMLLDFCWAKWTFADTKTKDPCLHLQGVSKVRSDWNCNLYEAFNASLQIQTPTVVWVDLLQVTNTRHRITLPKLRFSNHKLAIETGRYSRPFKKPEGRICPICKTEMDDECDFLNMCLAYQEKRCSLLDYLDIECKIKIRRMSPNKIFMFLINPPRGNAKYKN